MSAPTATWLDKCAWPLGSKPELRCGPSAAAYVIDGLRSGALSEGEAADLLGVNRVDVRAMVAVREAEARPPLLSDWFRACEGTALGEPTWGTGEDEITAYFPAIGASVYVQADMLAAQVWDTETTHALRTPAELRAALDRLAAEVKP